MISCGGEAISDAQGFEPNKPPVIDGEGFSVERVGGGAYNKARLVSNMSFRLSAAVSDPENAELSYSFSSDYGSFTSQVDSAGGSSVIFVTGNLKNADTVSVILTVSDPARKHNTAVYEKVIGYGKPLPVISISNDAITVASSSSVDITLTSDSTGSFQLIENDSAASASEVHLDTKKNVFGIAIPDGDTSSSTVATMRGPTASAGTVTDRTIKISSSGTHKIWVIFRDVLDQEVGKLCTVTVP
jgi:hypothetical protein